MTEQMNDVRAITIFCGAASGAGTKYQETVANVGRYLATQRIRIVYGGAATGLMGVLADAALECGGSVTGVLPRELAEHEVEHRGLTDLHLVDGMHERKALMARFGDAFLVLPGGFGTADEMFEIVTWSQLGLHAKPVGLLNVQGYFDLLLEWIRRACQDGFVHGDVAERLLVSGSLPKLLKIFREYRPAPALFERLSSTETETRVQDLRSETTDVEKVLP